MSEAVNIVITGLGAVSPIGHTVEEFWASLLAGKSGTRALDFPWLRPEVFRTRVGAPLMDFDLLEMGQGYIKKDLRLLDPTTQLALAASYEALVSAGLDVERIPGKPPTRFRVAGVDRDRVATAIGSGMGGLSTLEWVHRHWVEHGNFKGTGFMKLGLPMLIPNAPSANTAIQFGFRGECRATATACASGTMSIGEAYRILSNGEADVALAGGADRVLSDHDGLGLSGFDQLRVMSARNDDGETASRPFAADRDGFVLGEGAGALVLETEEHAKARGARPLARLLAQAMTCDAHNMMQPDPEGAMVQRALELSIERSGLKPSDIGYVNCHGTATLAGDPVEAAAMRRVFGEGSGAPLVSSTKSMTGHCIGASGALEAVATVKTLETGFVHQTANLNEVAEGCELNHVTQAPTEANITAAVSASYGFGGHDCALVFAKI